MHIINNINAKTFSHNGRNYVKNFIVIKQGATNIAIHNAYDTKFQLVGSTHFSQFQVNGVVYTSQADLMANLVNILFVKNLGAGVISNTSELINDGADGINPFVTVADLPSANKILNQTGYNLSGETLTINADWIWLIANQQYTNDDVVEINVPLASSGMTRIDLIVADNNNTFQRIAGAEAVDNAIAPPVPNNTIQATLIVVTDGIIETEPTPVGDLYLEKLDEGIGLWGSSSGTIANFILKKYTNYIITDTSSVTQINSASFQSPVFSYVGKRIRITNQQSTPILFKHNFGVGVLKFDLVDDTDYTLNNDETISFIVKDDYTLLQIIEIKPNNDITTSIQSIFSSLGTLSNDISYLSTELENIPTYELQNVTDNGNSTTNSIVSISEDDNSPTTIIALNSLTSSKAGLLSNGSLIIGNNGNDAYLKADNLTDEQNINLPDSSGTIALIEQTVPLNGTTTGNPVTGAIEFLYGQSKSFFCEKLDGLNGPKKTNILIDQNNFKVENDITQIDTNRRVINKFDMQKDGIFIDSHYRTPIGNSTKRPIPIKSAFKYWQIPDNEQSSLDFVQKGYVDYSNSLFATEIKTGGLFQGNKPIYRLLVEEKTDITGKLEIPIEIDLLLPATSGHIVLDNKQFIIPTYYDEGVKKYSATIHYNVLDKKVVVLLVSNSIGSLPIADIPVRLQLEYTKPA